VAGTQGIVGAGLTAKNAQSAEPVAAERWGQENEDGEFNRDGFWLKDFF